MKLFGGFVAASLVLLLLLTFVHRPMSERLKTLRDDGVRFAEVYERIVQNPQPVDIAFIGTSHTMNGIDDRSLQESLAKEGIAGEVTNLGMMWMGRDLHLMLIKQLLTSKKPRIIVLEINEHEPPYGHPLLPYVGSASDMFCCRSWADFNFPKMFLLFLKEQLYGSVSDIWNSAPSTSGTHRTWEYGWEPIDRIWDPNVQHRRSLGDQLEDLVGQAPRAAGYRFISAYGSDTVRRIVDLAHSRGVPVYFLYLPEFAFAADPRPNDLAFYNRLGPVLQPPREIVSDPSNWGDFAHLNRTGSDKLVPYLSSAIADLLRVSNSTTKRRGLTSSADRS